MVVLVVDVAAEVDVHATVVIPVDIVASTVVVWLLLGFCH